MESNVDYLLQLVVVNVVLNSEFALVWVNVVNELFVVIGWGQRGYLCLFVGWVVVVIVRVLDYCSWLLHSLCCLLVVVNLCVVVAMTTFVDMLVLVGCCFKTLVVGCCFLLLASCMVLGCRSQLLVVVGVFLCVVRRWLFP